jgi:hypothetical protein
MTIQDLDFRIKIDFSNMSIQTKMLEVILTIGILYGMCMSRKFAFLTIIVSLFIVYNAYLQDVFIKPEYDYKYMGCNLTAKPTNDTELFQQTITQYYKKYDPKNYRWIDISSTCDRHILCEKSQWYHDEDDYYKVCVPCESFNRYYCLTQGGILCEGDNCLWTMYTNICYINGTGCYRTALLISIIFGVMPVYFLYRALIFG